MKKLITLCLFSALLAAPAVAAEKSAADCPGKAQMGEMQKSMGTLLGDSEGMMKMMKDPAQRARMQKMHDQMSLMMVNMRKMNGQGGMMGGSMMQGAKPNPAPEDHETHHADK